jgi:hypothetical protein
LELIEIKHAGGWETAWPRSGRVVAIRGSPQASDDVDGGEDGGRGRRQTNIDKAGSFTLKRPIRVGRLAVKVWLLHWRWCAREADAHKK